MTLIDEEKATSLKRGKTPNEHQLFPEPLLKKPKIVEIDDSYILYNNDCD